MGSRAGMVAACLACVSCALGFGASCGSPPEPDAPNRFEPAPQERPAPPTLSRTIGFGDPTHVPKKRASAELAIASETPALALRFGGSIDVASESVTVVSGYSRAVPFRVGAQRVKSAPARGAANRKPAPPDDVPAGIRTIRVAGFQGVDVGLDKSFYVPPPMSVGGTLDAMTLGLGSWWLSLYDTEPKPPEKPELFSLDVPMERYGRGRLLVSIPEGTPPGKYEGRLEIEGNFDMRTFPLRIDVTRYEDRVDALLSKIDAPVESLPLGALLAESAAPPKSTGGPKKIKGDAEKHSHASIDLGYVADGKPRTEGAWTRWIVAGTGIWDLASLEWLGPLTDTANNDFGNERVLVGPRAAPRLFVLNGRSVDVISVRDRRTIARIATPALDDLAAPLLVSPDGDRVVVGCGDAYCAFTHEGDGYKMRAISDACVFPQRCAWLERDPDLRQLFVGVATRDILHWDTVLRYDLASGARSQVVLTGAPAAPLPKEHRYSARHGLVVGVNEGDGMHNIVGFTTIHLDDLAVAHFPVPKGSVERLEIDDRSGDVFVDMMGDVFDDKTKSCTQLTPSTKKSRPCEGHGAGAPRLVPGTSITYDAVLDRVEYAR